MPPLERTVSGWAVASLVGGALGVLLVVLIVVVFKAVARVAENAGALLTAMEEVQTKTLVLADLEAESKASAQVAADAANALVELQRLERERNGDEKPKD